MVKYSRRCPWRTSRSRSGLLTIATGPSVDESRCGDCWISPFARQKTLNDLGNLIEMFQEHQVSAWQHDILNVGLLNRPLRDFIVVAAARIQNRNRLNMPY